jgi:hypothetical protein
MTTFIHRIFLFSILLFTGHLAYSQSNPLEKRATLQVQKEPLENILDAITQQTGVRFSYNSQLIDPKTKVTINAQNKTIKEILPVILPSSVSYKKVGDHIVFHAIPLKENDITKTDNPVNSPQSEISEKNASSDNGKLTGDGLYSVENLPKDTVSLIEEEEDMKAQIAGVLMALATASTPIVAQDTIAQSNEIQQQTETDSQDCNPFQFTFVYPLGTDWVNSAERCYRFSLNALGGVTGETKGLAVGGLFNINKYEATGAQIAGIFNHSETAHFQAAGIYNIAQKSNAQLAGIFNITKKGGFQLGLVNVRDTADGVSLGLINIVKQGGIMEAGIETGEFIHTAATFRSGVQRLYTKLSVGYNYTNDLWAFGAGLGTSFNLKKNLRLNLELTQTTLYNRNGFKVEFYDPDMESGFQEWKHLTQFVPMLNYRFAKHFKIYAGPSFNLLYQYGGWLENSYRVEAPYSIYQYNFTSTAADYHTLDFWIGVVCGIKF